MQHWANEENGKTENEEKFWMKNKNEGESWNNGTFLQKAQQVNQTENLPQSLQISKKFYFKLKDRILQ